MPVTAEMISGQRPGAILAHVSTTATDVTIKGPTVPITVIATREGSLSGGTVSYDPNSSTVVNGIVTIRLIASVAANYRIVPIYGVNPAVPGATGQ